MVHRSYRDAERAEWNLESDVKKLRYAVARQPWFTELAILGLELYTLPEDLVTLELLE